MPMEHRNRQQKSQSIEKRDILVIAFLLFVSIVSFAIFHMVEKREAEQTKDHKEQATVTVEVDGRIYQTADLWEDQEISVKNEKDEIVNVVKIQDGEVYMKEATCPDGLCILQGHLRSAAGSIICLPNKVVVRIKNEEPEKKTYDSIGQ